MGTLKKILTTGMGAALMTESGIRNALSDIQVTRQAKDYLTRQAMKGKEEFTKVLMGEVKRFLAHINLHEELQKALAGLTIEIETSIKILPASSKRPSKINLRISPGTSKNRPDARRPRIRD